MNKMGISLSNDDVTRLDAKSLEKESHRKIHNTQTLGIHLEGSRL